MSGAAATGGLSVGRTVLLLAAGAFASAASLRLCDPMLPALARHFGTTTGQAAVVVTATSVAYGVFQLLFGPLGDRFGKFRVVAWACLVSTLGALGCALSPSLETLAVARAFTGATTAAIIPLSMAWIGDVVPYAERQPVLARFLIGQIVGLSTGVWLGGFAADHLSWQAPYLLIALLFSGASLALFALQRRLPAAARRTVRAEGPAWKRTRSEFAQVLSLPWARTVLSLVFIEGMCLYGPFAFVATHVHQRFGLSLSSAGSLVMLFGLGGLLFALFSGRMVRRLGETGLARWGGALLCLSLLTIGFAPGWGWATLACFVLGLGFYTLHNTLQVNATQMAPERRGAAVSAFAACFFLGQSAGVTLGGWAVGTIGASRFMALGGLGLLTVSLTFAAALGRQRRAAAVPVD